MKEIEAVNNKLNSNMNHEIYSPRVFDNNLKKSDYKFVKDPFTHNIYELYRFKDKGGEILYYLSKIKKYPLNISDILEEEYHLFEHMDNLNRLNILKNSLDEEDNYIINSYPIPNMHINYSPIIYIALKYDPDFLLIEHKNLEVDAVNAIETYINLPIQKKLSMSIKRKNIKESIKFASKIYENKEKYIKNENELKELEKYIKENDNFKNQTMYLTFTKLLSLISINRSMI